jgi:DNA (cytosine-5)-methyltransferase 1
MRKNKALKSVDLFCGCGGMSLGFQNAGVKVMAAFDNWQPAVETYNYNFLHQARRADISESSFIDLVADLKPDLISGGPPCQDFSIAGKRDGDGSRANMTLIYSQIIANVRPRWFVMENVYNIEKFPVLKVALKVFKEAGYGVSKRVIDASYVGVPQMRRRYFVIGRQGVEDGFLDDMLDGGLSQKRTSVRDFLGDSLKTEYYYMHPRSYNRRAIFSVEEPSATIRGVNRPMPGSYKKHPADKTADFKRVRSLSSAERAMIQTFPGSYIFKGTKSAVEQMIGNAVPVRLAEYVAKAIVSFEGSSND